MKTFVFRTDFDVKAENQEEAYQLLTERLYDMMQLTNTVENEVGLVGSEFIEERV